METNVIFVDFEDKRIVEYHHWNRWCNPDYEIPGPPSDDFDLDDIPF
jgi:hypothetical protein